MSQGQHQAQSIFYDLPSGAKLEVQVAPIEPGEALFDAFVAELDSLQLNPEATVDVNLWKALACKVASSKALKKALEPCLDRCLYNNARFSPQTFEPVDRRQDLVFVRAYVLKENVLPFMNGLYAKLASAFPELLAFLK